MMDAFDEPRCETCQQLTLKPRERCWRCRIDPGYAWRWHYAGEPRNRYGRRAVLRWNIEVVLSFWSDLVDWFLADPDRRWKR